MRTAATIVLMTLQGVIAAIFWALAGTVLVQSLH